MTASDGPAYLVLTASVTRRYYLDGRSKVEIAQELGLRRFKVARLLENARTSGLVRIEIGYPNEIDLELSARLQEKYGLKHTVVWTPRRRSRPPCVGGSARRLRSCSRRSQRLPTSSDSPGPVR